MVSFQITQPREALVILASSRSASLKSANLSTARFKSASVRLANLRASYLSNNTVTPLPGLKKAHPATV